MFTVILIMLSGIIAGRLLRKRRLSFLPRVIMFFIWVLLFILGVEVGSDSGIIDNLQQLGLEAFVLAVAGVAGSVLSAWALWRYAGKDGKDER